MKNCRIAVTPLSPLHIGCGEVYEPTNYVVDPAKSLMYAFDPAGTKVSEGVRSEMMKAALTGRYQDMRAFFSRHLTDFRPWATAILPMDTGSLAAYRKMFNPTGHQKTTEFAVQRTAYRRLLQGICAYVPGSGLKGVAKTALVNRLNDGQSIDAKAINATLLGGDFDKSPFRFLKISDLQAENDRVQTRSRCAGRYFKSNDFKYCGITDFFETVEPAQYRAFYGEVVITGNKTVTQVTPAFDSIENLMRELHRYADANWKKEMGWYRAADSAWARSVEELLTALTPQIEAGKVALVRLGKNAGAESKTLTGAAQIQIRHRDKTKETKDHATTLWFTSERTPVNEDRANGMPFGWALVEVVEDTTSTALKVWCEKTAKRVKVDLTAEWQSVNEARKELLKAYEKREREEAEIRQQRLEAEQAEAKRQSELAAMSPERRLTEELVTQLEETSGVIGAGHQIFGVVRAAIESALQWENLEDKKNLALRLRPLMKVKGMFQGKAEKEFKRNLRTLAGEA